MSVEIRDFNNRVLQVGDKLCVASRAGGRDAYLYEATVAELAHARYPIVHNSTKPYRCARLTLTSNGRSIWLTERDTNRRAVVIPAP